MFLSIIGGRTYELLRNLVSPHLPETLVLNGTGALIKHFKPTPIITQSTSICTAATRQLPCRVHGTIVPPRNDIQKSFWRKHQSSQQARYVATDGGKSNTELPLFMFGYSASKPLYMNLLVKERIWSWKSIWELQFQSYSKCIFKQCFPNLKHNESGIQLRMYNGYQC